MKLTVLVVADMESPALWDYFDKARWKDVELIISCGDLKPAYLDFLVTMLSFPLLYVRGNHDELYDTQPPEGCIDLENEPFVYRGVRFIGLGGCKSGSPKPFHFTERAMAARVRRARLQLLKPALGGGFDVLVTHAPSKGLGDGEGFHEGFACFRSLLDRYHPLYQLYGHCHLYGDTRGRRVLKQDETTLINGFGYCLTELHFPDRDQDDTPPRRGVRKRGARTAAKPTKEDAL